MKDLKKYTKFRSKDEFKFDANPGITEPGFEQFNTVVLISGISWLHSGIKKSPFLTVQLLRSLSMCNFHFLNLRCINLDDKHRLSSPLS